MKIATTLRSDQQLTANEIYGLGGKNIQTLGEAICLIKFRNQIEEIKLLILGRDFLKKFNFVLAQSRLVYSKSKLMRINERMTKETDSCALSSDVLILVKRFDLIRPIKPAHIESVSHCNSSNDVSIDVSIPKDGKIMSEIPYIFAIDCIESEPVLEIGENLQPAEVNRLQQIINNCYVHPINIKVEPYEYEMSKRLTSDVPFHCSPRRL